MQENEPASRATIAARFERIARRVPDSIALRDSSGPMTYATLQDRANRFALFLRSNGVIPGDRVVVTKGRSAGTIIAILGILKCGGVYVPLDAQEPAERLSRVLADSAPSTILTGPQPPAVPGRLIVDLQQALDASASMPDDQPDVPCDPGDPACVMYTSGSTGQPKGVVVPHRAVLRLITDQSYAPFGPNETFLHLAPLAFDASTFEIWGALLHGGTLAIVEDDHPSLDRIVAALAEHRVTVAWFTAGLFALLVDHCLDGLASLRCLLAGGDVLSPAHVGRAYAALPDCSIVNGYGPTENTTFTCCYPVPRGGGLLERLPIGRPIAGTQVHILDPDFHPVAPGEVGQICCAGDGLAEGYLNQPQQTAEKFVRVPIAGQGTERVYLTGDLGRQRPDGVVEFLGRVDQQVKIRGKRVELGEVENALRRDPAVLDAAVTARNAPPDGKRLTAHLVLRPPFGDPEGTAQVVLRRLRHVLPDYMIPVQAGVLDALPLTANGKVDRARLPDVVEAVPCGLRPPGGGAGGIEDRVAAVWARVLGRSSVDRDGNFFDVGGNSLLLLSLHVQLQASFDPNLSLMTLFEHTSIRALAAHLSRGDRGARPTPQSKTGSSEDRRVLVRGAGR